MSFRMVNTIYTMVTINCGCKKLYSRWLPKVLTTNTKRKECAMQSIFWSLSTKWGSYFPHCYGLRYLDILHQRRFETIANAVATFTFTKPKKVEAVPVLELKNYGFRLWDEGGTIFVDFVERGQQMQLASTTKHPLNWNVRFKINDPLNCSGIILLHNYACPHTDASTE